MTELRPRLVDHVFAVYGVNGLDRLFAALRAEHAAAVAAAPVVDLRDVFAATFPEIAAAVARSDGCAS